MKRLASLLVAASLFAEGSAQAATAGLAPAGRVCEMFKAARGSFIVVVDEGFKVVDSDVLDLGDVDFSGARAANRKYFVVSSKNIDVETSLGGEEMRPSVSKAEAACAKVNVKAL